MKDAALNTLILIFFILGAVYIVGSLTGCATGAAKDREAKIDCLVSLPVGQVIGMEPIDWAEVKHWNCKR